MYKYSQYGKICTKQGIISIRKKQNKKELYYIKFNKQFRLHLAATQTQPIGIIILSKLISNAKNVFHNPCEVQICGKTIPFSPKRD